MSKIIIEEMKACDPRGTFSIHISSKNLSNFSQERRDLFKAQKSLIEYQGIPQDNEVKAKLNEINSNACQRLTDEHASKRIFDRMMSNDYLRFEEAIQGHTKKQIEKFNTVYVNDLMNKKLVEATTKEEWMFDKVLRRYDDLYNEMRNRYGNGFTGIKISEGTHRNIKEILPEGHQRLVEVQKHQENPVSKSDFSNIRNQQSHQNRQPSTKRDSRIFSDTQKNLDTQKKTFP